MDADEMVRLLDSIPGLRSAIKDVIDMKVRSVTRMVQQQVMAESLIVIEAFKQAHPDMDDQAMAEAMKLYPPEPNEVLLNYLDRLHTLTMKETP